MLLSFYLSIGEAMKFTKRSVERVVHEMHMRLMADLATGRHGRLSAFGMQQCPVVLNFFCICQASRELPRRGKGQLPGFGRARLFTCMSAGLDSLPDGAQSAGQALALVQTSALGSSEGGRPSRLF